MNPRTLFLAALVGLAGCVPAVHTGPPEPPEPPRPVKAAEPPEAEKARAAIQRAEEALAAARKRKDGLRWDGPARPVFAPVSFRVLNRGRDRLVGVKPPSGPGFGVVEGTTLTLLDPRGKVRVETGPWAGRTGTVPPSSFPQEVTAAVGEFEKELKKYERARGRFNDEVEEICKAETDAALDLERAKESLADLGRPKPPAPPVRKAREYTSGPLVLLLDSLEGTTGPTFSEVRGVVENRGTKKLRYVQVVFATYEGERRVGSVLTNTLDLGPGEKWSFRAVSPTRFTSFKVTRLEGR